MQWLKVRSLQGEQNVGKPKAQASGLPSPVANPALARPSKYSWLA